MLVDDDVFSAGSRSVCYHSVAVLAGLLSSSRHEFRIERWFEITHTRSLLLIRVS